MRFAFYAAQAGKVWNGDSLDDGLGGSESAVVYMARELARQGHEVTVFTRGEPGVYAEVAYIPFDWARSWLMTRPLDVLVCSRDGSPLYWPHRANMTVFWSHDLPQGPLPEANLYFFVSTWHANTYMQVAPQHKDRVRVSPNGVDATLLTHQVKVRPFTPDDTPKLVWTSNPERGLWYAGQVLEGVQQTFPKAELHVFGRNSVYGWGSSYEHVFSPDTARGVCYHHALGKTELMLQLAQMDLLVYPTWWPETFCIATLEAQAVGLPVVASEFGALPETVRGGVLIPGNVNHPDHLRLVTEMATDLLNDQEVRRTLSETGKAFARQFLWQDIAARWSDLFAHAAGLVA